MRILVSGASGFIGRALCLKLKSEGLDYLGAVRKNTFIQNCVIIGEVNSDTNWNSVVNGVDIVVHTAARAHVRKDEVSDPLEEYRNVNVEGTLNFARQSAASGVKRFIFISSIGVNGNISKHPFSEDDEPSPVGFYAQSKWEAVQGLWNIQRETGIEVVIIRPPLVYGPGAPGNFGSLMRTIEKGIPLPLGAIHNQRSLVALDNLIDLIMTCMKHPAAANQVFIAGDGQDLSTTELLRGLGYAMGRPARLIPVPAGLLMFGAALLGKKMVAQQLLGSLQVDISKARELLGWVPPVSVDEALKRSCSSLA